MAIGLYLPIMTLERWNLARLIVEIMANMIIMNTMVFEDIFEIVATNEEFFFGEQYNLTECNLRRERPTYPKL